MLATGDKILKVTKDTSRALKLIFLPVAQLDSASDSDSEGRRFESYRVGQKKGLAPPGASENDENKAKKLNFDK